jgi:predicted transcriptional regulator
MAARHRVAPTTVRIPPGTLARIDALAEQLDMTRNRFIVDVLSRYVNDANFDALDPRTVAEIDQIPGQITVDEAVDEAIREAEQLHSTETLLADAYQDRIEWEKRGEKLAEQMERHLHHYQPIAVTKYYKLGIPYAQYRCECGDVKTDKFYG